MIKKMNLCSFLKKLSDKQIVLTLLLNGFATTLFSSSRLNEINSQLFFLKIIFLTSISWISGFVFLAIFLKLLEINIHKYQFILLKIGLSIILIVLFMSPLIWTIFYYNL